MSAQRSRAALSRVRRRKGRQQESFAGSGEALAPASRLDRLGEAWYALWRRKAGLRMAVEFTGALLLIVGVATFALEVYKRFDDQANREEDRAVRNALLLAQIAEIASQNHQNAHSGIIPMLELLARENVSMVSVSLIGVRLPFANIETSDLSYAILRGADLTEARLAGADLRYADLSDATLDGTDMSDVNLSGTNFDGARVSTNLTVAFQCAGHPVEGLTADISAPPIVPCTADLEPK